MADYLVMQRTAMRISPQGDFGVVVDDFDPTSPDDIRAVKRAVYRERIAVVKGVELDPHQFVALASGFGEPVRYYEPIYHHPEVPEVFVSSNIDSGEQRVGVPKTGKFWHSDYGFMPRPFDLNTVVRSMTALTRNVLRNSIEIGSITNKIGRSPKRSGRRRRQKIWRPGSKTDDDERAAHSRLPSPGISTIEK